MYVYGTHIPEDIEQEIKQAHGQDIDLPAIIAWLFSQEIKRRQEPSQADVLHGLLRKLKEKHGDDMLPYPECSEDKTCSGCHYEPRCAELGIKKENNESGRSTQ